MRDEGNNSASTTVTSKTLPRQIGKVVLVLMGLLVVLVLALKGLIDGGAFDGRIKRFVLDRYRVKLDYEVLSWSIPLSFKVTRPRVVAAEAENGAAPIECEQASVRLVRSDRKWAISNLEVKVLKLSLGLDDDWQVKRFPGDLQLAFPDLMEKEGQDGRSADLTALPVLGAIAALHKFQKLDVVDSEITILMPEGREVSIAEIRIASKTADEILIGTMTADVRAAGLKFMARIDLQEADIRFAVAEGKKLRLDSTLALAHGKATVRLTANECVLSKYRSLAQFAGVDLPELDGALFGTCVGEFNLFELLLNHGSVRLLPAISVVKGSLELPDWGQLRTAALNLEGSIEYSLPDKRIQWDDFRLDTAATDFIQTGRIIHLDRTDTLSKSGEFTRGSWKADLQSKIKMGELDISLSCSPAAEGETLKMRSLKATAPGIGNIEADLTFIDFKRLTEGTISLTKFFPQDALKRIAKTLPLSTVIPKLPDFPPEGELSIHAELKNLPVSSSDWLSDLKRLSSKADIKSSFLHTEGRYDGRANLDFSNEELKIQEFEIQTPIGSLQIEGRLSSSLNEIKEGTVRFTDIAPGDYATQLSLPKELEKILVESTGSGHLKFVNTTLPLDVLVATSDRPFPFRELVRRGVIEGSLELKGPESLKAEVVFAGKEEGLTLVKLLLDWKGLGQLLLTGTVARDLETLTNGQAKLSGASVSRIQELFGSLAPEMRKLKFKGGLEIVAEVHDFPLLSKDKERTAEATFEVQFDKPDLSYPFKDFSLSASSKRWMASGNASAVLGKNGYRISDLRTRLSCEGTDLLLGERSFKSAGGAADLSMTEAGANRYSLKSSWTLDIDQDPLSGSIKLDATSDQMLNIEEAVFHWDKVLRFEAKAQNADLRLLAESWENAGRAVHQASLDIRLLDVGKLQAKFNDYLPEEMRSLQLQGAVDLSLQSINGLPDAIPVIKISVSTPRLTAAGIIKSLKAVTSDSPVTFTVKGAAVLSCVPDWTDRAFSRIEYSVKGFQLDSVIPVEVETIHTSLKCALSNDSIEIREAGIRWPGEVSAVFKGSATRFNGPPKNQQTPPPMPSFTLGKDIPLGEFIGFTQLHPVSLELQNIDVKRLSRLTRTFASGMADHYTPSGKLKLSFKTGPGMLIGNDLSVLRPPEDVTLLLEMKKAGLLPIDENKVEGIENLNLDLKAILSKSKAPGETAVDFEAEIKADSFSVYRDLFFLDFTNREVGLGLKGRFFNPSHFEIEEGKLSLSNAFQIGISKLVGKNVERLVSQAFQPGMRDGRPESDQHEDVSLSTRLLIDVSSNDQLLTDLRKSFGDSVRLLNLLELTGKTNLEAEIQAGHGEVRARGKYRLEEADVSYGETYLEGVNASVPFELGWPRDPPKNSVGLPFGKLTVKTLSSGIVFLENLGLSLKLEDNRLYTAAVDQLFYGGTLKISPIMTNSLLSDDIRAEVSLKIEGMQIARLLQSFLLQDLKGVANIDLNKIQLGGNDLSLEGNANFHVFGGSIEMTNLAVKDLFSNLSRLELDLVAKDLSIGEATKVIQVGEMTGILEGYIKGLQFHLSTGQPIRFDSSFKTVKNPGVTQYITADAVHTLSGKGKLAADIFDIKGKHRYKAFGFDASLKNDLIRIKGLAQKDGREEILSPALVSRVKFSVRFPAEIRYRDFESGVIRAYEGVLESMAEGGSKPKVEVK